MIMPMMWPEVQLNSNRQQYPQQLHFDAFQQPVLGREEVCNNYLTPENSLLSYDSSANSGNFLDTLNESTWLIDKFILVEVVKYHGSLCSRSQITFCSLNLKNGQISPYMLNQRANWSFYEKIHPFLRLKIDSCMTEWRTRGLFLPGRTNIFFELTYKNYFAHFLRGQNAIWLFSEAKGLHCKLKTRLIYFLILVQCRCTRINWKWSYEVRKKFETVRIIKQKMF